MKISNLYQIILQVNQDFPDFQVMFWLKFLWHHILCTWT